MHIVIANNDTKEDNTHTEEGNSNTVEGDSDSEEGDSDSEEGDSDTEESDSDTEEDKFVEHVEDKTLYTLSGYSAPVAVNPVDSSQVATGCDGKLVCLWQLGNQEQQQHQKLENHKEGITSLQFSSDGRVLASGSYDGKINLWDTATGALIRQLRGPSGTVEWLQWHPKCQDLILAGSSDSRAYLWEPRTGTCIQKFKAHFAPVCIGSFAPNGNFTLTGDALGYLNLWDYSEKVYSSVKHYHKRVTTCMDFTEDSSRAVVGTLDGWATVINTVTGEYAGVFHGHHRVGPGSIKSIYSGSVWWSSRPWAVTGGHGRVIMWDLTRLEKLHHYKLPSISPLVEAQVDHCVWSPDSHVVYTGSSDGRVRVFDYRLPEELVRVFSGSRDTITSVAVGNGGSLVVAGSADHVVRFFDLRASLVS